MPQFSVRVCKKYITANKSCRRARLTSPIKCSTKDVVLRSVCKGSEVVVLVMQGTELVDEAINRHKTVPTSSAALGRCIVGATLLGAFEKEGRVVQVNFRGNGPAGVIQATANNQGLVRGRIQNPSADAPLNSQGKLNVKGIVGKGVLSVVRSHPLQPQPYTGIVPIVSGEIAEDLAYYLAESEQTNSALALGVSINRSLNVQAAGGYFVQVLPNVTQQTLQLLESNIADMDSVTNCIGSGMNAMEITENLLKGIGIEESAQATTIKPLYGPCDIEQLKERMKSALVALGETEVLEILEDQGKIEMKDEFCQTTVEFNRQEIMELLATAQNK